MPQSASPIQYLYRQKKGTVHLRGSVNVILADELRQAFLKALQDPRCTDFSVSLAQVEHLDVSALQLLLSFQKACHHKGCSFSVMGTPVTVQAALARLGICF